MAFLYPRHNGALNANPPGGDLHITTHASDWLWAVFALMLLSFILVSIWTFTSRQHNRILHFIPLMVLAVASVAYFSMASDLGWTLIRAEFDGNPTRQIWYVRYIQYFINAPLILLSLLTFTRLSTPYILTVLFFSWFLVINGLVGALVQSSYKWAYFVFALIGLFFIWGSMVGHIPFMHGAFAYNEFKRTFIFGAAYISFIWMLYPIAWGLSEGGNAISPTGEMVFYGVLDLMSAPLYLFVYIARVTRFSEEMLRSTGFGTAARGELLNGPAAPVAPAPRKEPQPEGAAAVAAPAATR